MDITSLFGSTFLSPKILELSSDLVVPLSFPGGSNVSAVEGRFLSNDGSWKELYADLFISAEEVLNSLCSISGNIKDMITIPLIVSHSNGKCRRVSIYDELGQKQNVPEVIHTFVPVTIIMGLLLLNLHKFEVSKKLRFAEVASQSMELALDVYPRQGQDKNICKDGLQHVHRFMDTNTNVDEFEESQGLKCKENYRIMRYLIPPNIARTDLRKMLADGVPQKIADRVWRKKALWLLCMHPSDIPKVHIADLRGKYDCFGLDIVELGALWHILPRWEGGSPKAEWRRALKSRLDELVGKEMTRKISPSESRDSAYEGSEGLMIYDPDRPLYRQFGVSASAAGLQPGQRRSAVFTSVDLRQTTVSAQAQASKANSPTNPSSSAYHSPNTDSEREGESTGSTRPSTWARCASGRDMREDLILSGSESGKRRKNGTASRKKHRRKKRSAKGVEGREARQGSVSLPGSSVMKSMMPLEPSLVSEGSHLLQGIAADSHGCRTQKGKDDDECTDRDAELDDLLNYEINLSCLDLDLDLADCLSIDSDLVSDDSCDSRGQGLVEEIGWRVVSEDADEVISDCETLPPGSGGASPHSIHTPRVRLEHDLQTAGPLLSTDGTDTTSRIENFRPFTLQAMMKKPVKRLNFIAAPAKTPESRQWLSSLDSSGQINFDATPDFIYDHGKKRSYRSVQNNPMSTSTAKKVQGSGRASTLPPWGSAGAKRRNAPSSSASATRSNQQSDSSEVSTPLEVIYCSAAADSENFDFNPQIFSADPAIAVPLDISAALSTKKNSRLYESFKVITSQSKPPSPDLGFTNDGAYLALGISRSGSPESLIVLDKPSGPGSSASSLFTPEYEQRGFNFEERRGQVVRSSSEVCETGDKSFESGFQDVPMRSVDSLVSSQGRQTESTSVFSFSTFSMHSMQSAVKHLFAAPSKSTEYSEKNSKSLLGEGQLESKRADEKQRVSEIVEEPERSGDVIIPSSPRCLSTPVNVPSSSSSSAMHQDSESRRRSKILKIDSASVTPARKLNITPGDDHSQRIFSNTFTTQSPKMDRRISREEELADSEIEAEIDNFIVPDELSPVALRQHGVVMNTREVNGIRQNALMSLPALLDEIGRVSMGNSEDADEDGIEEMSETELGLWGDEAEADAEGDQEEAPDCGNDFIRSQVMAGGEERDGTDNIERLIPDDMDPTPTTRGALMRAQSDAKGEAKFGETCRDVVYWTEDSEAVAEGDVAPADTNTDTDSEGSTYASKKPLKPSLPCSTPPKAADPVVVLTPEEAQELILFREARLALLALETGALRVNKDLATKLLLKLAEDPNAVTEPLETLVLLVDKLGADVNATGCDSMTPLHSLFSNPALGRFILSRGGDVLSKDHYGDSVLSLCAEYGYSWVLPAFISMHGREAKLLEDPVRAHEYAVILLALWGFGARVKELVDEGIVSFSADEALELLDNCAYNFGNMKEPVETFELLESLILKG